MRFAEGFVSGLAAFGGTGVITARWVMKNPQRVFTLVMKAKAKARAKSNGSNGRGTTASPGS